MHLKSPQQLPSLIIIYNLFVFSYNFICYTERNFPIKNSFENPVGRRATGNRYPQNIGIYNDFHSVEDLR